jgi:hypothetical protein
MTECLERLFKTQVPGLYPESESFRIDTGIFILTVPPDDFLPIHTVAFGYPFFFYLQVKKHHSEAS